MGVPWWVWPHSVVLLLAHVYLWRRLVVNPTRPRGWPRRIGTVVVLLLGLSAVGALIGMHALSPAGGRWVTWPGFVWYGVLVYLLSVFVLAEPIRLGFAVRRRIRRRRGEPEVDEGRRRVLARGLALGAGVLAVGVTGYGMATALRPPRLERVTVRIRRLPPAAAGFRIALVADTHLGPFLGEDNLRRVVRMVNDTKPDLVVIPGDLIDGTVADLGPAVAPLLELRSTHGTYFSTGNHEYLFDADAWVAHLRGMGIRTLRNERVALPHFDLAGVNDSSGAGVGDPPDFRRALDGRDTSRPVVLLAHQPAQVYDARRYDVDLQLSGHTHGGQFFPGSVVTGLGQPVLSGLGRVGATQLYVTSGTGFWGPAIRVGSTPEVTLIELARG